MEEAVILNCLKNNYLSAFFLENFTINQTNPTTKCSIIIPPTRYIKVLESLIMNFNQIYNFMKFNSVSNVTLEILRK